MGLSSKQAFQDDSLEYWSQIGDHLDINPSLNPKLAANECKNNQQRLQSYKGPPLNCPRCDSTNTKFCYYNNYSKLQPRHFCRACKRHWTAGGTLRNVPVGGSSRKNSKRTAKTTTPKATITTSSSTVVNNINEKQQQQSVDTIFPEIFGQVMFQPDQMIMEPQMKLDTEIGIGVGSSSSSDSRLFGYKGQDESLLNLMDLGPAGYSGGEGWNAASYWNYWDGLNDGV